MRSVESIVVLVLVALAGLVGFRALGDAQGDAIAGDVRHASETRAMPTVASQAAVAKALEVVERAAAVAADVEEVVNPKVARVERLLKGTSKGLYRNVPLKIDYVSPYSFDADRVVEMMDAVYRGRTRAQFVKAGYLSDPASSRLTYDLFKEYLRVRTAMFGEEFMDGDQWMFGPIEESIMVVDPMARGGDAKVQRLLEGYRGVVQADGEAVPEAFLRRVEAFVAIHRDGITEAERAEAFGRGKFAPDVIVPPPLTDELATELAEFLGPFKGYQGSRGGFELKYLADPEEALAALPSEARSYLEGEVLPFLQRKPERAKGEPVRTISPEVEAKVVSSIVVGDPEGVESTFAARQRWGASVTEAKEASTFAARMFERQRDVKVLPFDADEAETLIRWGATDDTELRARPEGGEMVADVLTELRRVGLDRSPGRAEEQVEKALGSWVRAAAQGDSETTARIERFAEQLVVELPASVRRAVTDLLARFDRAPVAD